MIYTWDGLSSSGKINRSKPDVIIRSRRLFKLTHSAIPLSLLLAISIYDLTINYIPHIFFVTLTNCLVFWSYSIVSNKKGQDFNFCNILAVLLWASNLTSLSLSFLFHRFKKLNVLYPFFSGLLWLSIEIIRESTLKSAKLKTNISCGCYNFLVTSNQLISFSFFSHSLLVSSSPPSLSPPPPSLFLYSSY